MNGCFQQYIGKPLEEAKPDGIRHHQVYLLEDRKLAKGTVVIHIAALRFLYVRVLKGREMKENEAIACARTISATSTRGRRTTRSGLCSFLDRLTRSVPRICSRRFGAA